ncbi:MAG TPA: tetratricopeptide repeat protein [Candidatus Limnocylindrales bacterium]|nr:tetratricopeptide repeat protein [Candidatus Limnocylindrales bacterium]
MCPRHALAQAPIPSSEAQKDFASASKKLNAGDFIGAVPLFQRAVEHDQNFAMAYMGLGLAYRNLKQYAPSIENLQKAFDLSDHASDKEKLMIAATYHSLDTGDLDKARQAYEKWAHDYPQDSVPHNNLGVIYGYLGQYEKQRDEFLEAIRLKPDSPVARANLVSAYSHLYLVADAKTAYEQTLARKLESPKLHYYRYGVAFLEADAPEMARQSAWTAGHPEADDILLSPQSDTEGFSGHLAKAREFSRRASESAQRAGDKEMAAWREMNAALREAEFGNAAQARTQTASGLALDSSQGIQILAALALARAGDSDQVQKMADDLQKQNPFNTTIIGYWLPSIRAALELNRQNPSKAVEFLQAAAPYDLGEPDPAPELGGYLYPVYLRGLAFLALRQGSAAAAEFQKFIDRRGVVINCPLGALAHLGLARAYALQGDTSKARAAYQDFLALWKDADPDIPILKDAKSESAKLQ